jgi:tRNA 2-thiouridine synthesizing protein A
LADDAPATLDLAGLKCPLPVLRTRKVLAGMSAGSRLSVITTDPLAVIDIPALLNETGDRLERVEAGADRHVFHIERLARPKARG